MDNFWLYFTAICGVICITCFIAAIFSNNIKRKKSLALAANMFGKYTDSLWVASREKHILYDNNTRNILLNNRIFNTDLFNGYKTNHQSAVTKVTYKEQTIIKTNTESALARGLTGAVIAGPVGAAVGVSTAEKKIETKNTPVSYNYLRAEKFIIDIINKEGKVETSLITEKYNEFQAMKRFLDPIIKRLS